MSNFDSVLNNFRAVFTGTPAPEPALDLNMVEFEGNEADAETVHRVRWELDRMARKRDMERQRQKLADATPTPEFSSTRKGEEL